jgi:hypothetical protein
MSSAHRNAQQSRHAAADNQANRPVDDASTRTWPDRVAAELDDEQ